MPHRRALGEKAVDQLAESELGRLALRGELEPVLATAGADYARHWRGYIASLCAPRAFVACRRQVRLEDGRVRIVRMPSSLSMRTFRPIVVGILRGELKERCLVAEFYLLSGFVNMHDLVDHLEQRLVVVNLAVMHFLWLAPAAIKQNLGRCNACHRWAIRFHHDTGQRFDGRLGV